MHWVDLLSFSEEELASLDPVRQNLVVAQGLTFLSWIDVERYVQIVDEWTDGFCRVLPRWEREFAQTPYKWKSDIDFFHAGAVVNYIDVKLGIRYNEDQREVKKISYTDPNDVFLTGIIDTRRGTCANMTTLCAAISWRMGWPLFLALAKHHVFCRYDDGTKQFNFEVTPLGKGAFSSPDDQHYIDTYNLPLENIACGSDIIAVKPKQHLGIFFGFRARHNYDVQDTDNAKQDFQHAIQLFPENKMHKNMYDQTVLMEAIHGSRSKRPVDPSAVCFGGFYEFLSRVPASHHNDTEES